MKLLLLVLSFAVFTTAKAEVNTTDCIAQSEMQAIASHFQQFAPKANADFCNDDSKEWHLATSLMFMRQTQFSPNMQPSKDELFSGRFAGNWYEYFIGRIDNLEVVDSCPKGVIAYVYMFGDKTMYTCPMALTTSFSSLDRASVMMHEARHIDGFPHMMCTHGARKGMNGACDTKIADGGSYAVTVETYAQLAKFAEGVHPAMKAYARSSAVIYAEEAFENAVKINRTQNLLVLTKDLNFHSLNVEKNEVKDLGKAPALGHIVKRAQHMILFPDDKSVKAQYVFSNDEGAIAQSPNDFVTEYNTQTPEQKSNLVDYHIAAQWSARVFKKNVVLVCDPASPALKELPLPNGLTAAGLIYPDGYARDKYTVQLTTETGEIFDVSCLNKQPSLKPSAMKLDQKFSRIHKVNNQTLALTAEGSLFKIEAGRSTPLSTTLDGNITEMLPQDSFEFFQ